MTDLDQLDIMRRAITTLGLGQVAPEDLVAEARASSSRREEARRLLSDANVRIKDLESALRDLGVDPGGDLPGEVRAITNRIAGDSAAAQHDLDCALRERDRAIDDARIAAARIKDLEAKIASNVAEAAARDMRITDLERDLTTKADTLKTAHAALTRICDVIGAPIPGCPDDVVEAVAKQLGDDSDAEHRAKTAEQALKDINLALLDVQAPRAYRLADNTERPISDADRVRILGDRVRGEWREKERVSADHSERGKIIGDAHLALDDLKAPRLADGLTLTPAARIRALPR